MGHAEAWAVLHRNLRLNVPRAANGRYQCKHCGWACEEEGDVEGLLADHAQLDCEWAQLADRRRYRLMAGSTTVEPIGGDPKRSRGAQ